MLIRTRDHEYVAATHSLKTCKDVGRNTKTGHVSDVARAVGVGPSNINYYRLSHGFYFIEADSYTHD